MSELNCHSQLGTQALPTTTIILASSELRVAEITTEIQQQKRQTIQAIIQIGKLLDEAMGHLKKEGKWLKWLSTSVNISERMAQRYIQLARAFPDPTSVSGLGMTKALALLALPEAQREDFIIEPHEINGTQKKINEMSVREVRRAVREQTKPAKKAVEAIVGTQTTQTAQAANGASEETGGSLPKLRPVFSDRINRVRPDDQKESESSFEPSDLRELAPDLISAHNHLDGILKILDARATDSVMQDRIADDLRSLHQKIMKCLRLAKLEAPAD